MEVGLKTSLESGFGLSDDQPSSRSLSRVSSSEQKTLCYPGIQGFQEAFVRSQSKRPNIRTKLLLVPLPLRKCQGFQGSVPANDGTDQYVFSTTLYLQNSDFISCIFNFCVLQFLPMDIHPIPTRSFSLNTKLPNTPSTSIMWMNCMIFSSPHTQHL